MLPKITSREQQALVEALRILKRHKHSGSLWVEAFLHNCRVVDDDGKEE